MKQLKKDSKIKLIVSDDKTPKVKLKPGMNIRVEEFSIVDEDLLDLKKHAARLCGGSGTCLALVNIDTDTYPEP